MAPTISIVAPMYNEARNLTEFHDRVARVMNGTGLPWELLCIDDGSRDDTLERLRELARNDRRVGIIGLSRNFGKEIATTAGLDHARGEAVIVIDADLQDPPEVIPELIAAWSMGSDMVLAKRRVREGETWMKRATARGFYRLMRTVGDVALPENVGDFRLMSRRAVDAVLKMREQHRFMKGLFAWVGFPACTVVYDRAPRHRGRSSWGYWRLWNLAIEGITSFTVLPLKIATYLGLCVAVFAAAFGFQLIVRTVLFGNPVAGYPSLMAVVLFLGGTQLITLGVIGEYLGRIFNETKARPLYIVATHIPPGGMS
jgi:glycosyltransferase involved in cell wall biosynthesis